MNASAHPPAVPFLWGSFETFPLDHVFAALALSRQLVDIRLADAEQEVGAITVKAGHVLGAEDFRTRARGAAALQTLIRDPGTTFSVTTLPVDQGEMRNVAVVGTLADLFPETGNGHARSAPAPAPDPGRPEADAATDRPRQESGPPAPSGRAGGEPAADADGHTGPSLPPDRTAQRPADDSPRAAVSEAREARAPSAETAPAPAAAPASARAAASRGAPAADGVILRGTLEAIRFEELLEMLQPSPEPLHISFRRNGDVVGTLDLMSRQVIRTVAGTLHGRAAFTRLHADPGETFEVRIAEGAGLADALGSLSELLVEAQEAGTAPSVRPAVPQSERSLFMAGRLADFPFDRLVASLHLCRQPIELELRGGGKVLHRVQLRAGGIVSAESGGTGSGEAALAAIRENPGTEFIVYRRKEFADGAAIAPLQVLLAESDPAPAPDQETRTADRPADVPAGPARSETGTEDLAGIEGRLDALAGHVAELRQTLETERRASGEAPQAGPELAEFVQATTNFVTALEQTHQDALQKAYDTLRPRHLGMLRVVIVLQFGCLVLVGCLAALVAL